MKSQKDPVKSQVNLAGQPLLRFSQTFLCQNYKTFSLLSKRQNYTNTAVSSNLAKGNGATSINL
jgi:hypothetical protein